MTILAVDTQPERLRELVGKLREVFPKEKIVDFSVPALAVRHSFRAEVSLVFTRADMKRLGGLQVAQGVRFYCPNAKIFLVTDEKTPKSVFRQREISGFLPSPVTADAIRTTVELAGWTGQDKESKSGEKLEAGYEK